MKKFQDYVRSFTTPEQSKIEFDFYLEANLLPMNENDDFRLLTW